MNPNDVNELSSRTRRLVEVFFTEEDRPEAIAILDSLGKLRSERICFGCLKLSIRTGKSESSNLPPKGSLNQLRNADRLALTDYRDLLMSAEYGHDVNQHESWFRGIQGPSNRNVEPTVDDDFDRAVQGLVARVASGCAKFVVVLVGVCVLCILSWLLQLWLFH